MNGNECSSIEVTITDVFSETIECFRTLTEEIEGSDGAKQMLNGGHSFSSDLFWNKLNLSMTILSDASTKLCLAYTTGCLKSAKDARPLLSGLENAALNVVSTFMSLPLEQGLTLRQFVCASIIGIMESVITLITSLSQPQKKESKRHLQATGHTWEFSDKLSNLPRNNKEAVANKATESLELVSDALQELESNLEEGNADDEDIYGECDLENVKWSESDRFVVTTTIGLVKTAKACVKKTVDVLRSKESEGSGEAILDTEVVERLDGVAEEISKLSPAVDDLASTLYEIRNLTAVRNACSTLAGAVSSTLLSLRELMTLQNKPDVKWIDFLDKAAEHNTSKINDLINRMQSKN